jgi:phage-related protein
LPPFAGNWFFPSPNQLSILSCNSCLWKLPSHWGRISTVANTPKVQTHQKFKHLTSIFSK